MEQPSGRDRMVEGAALVLQRLWGASAHTDSTQHNPAVAAAYLLISTHPESPEAV